MALVNKLNIPQKIGGQAVIGAFCTVAAIIGESEAGLELPIMRHHIAATTGVAQMAY